MKKLFMIGTLCAALVFFVSATALADEVICGTMEVDAITVYESYDSDDVPIAPCDLEIYFRTATQGPWVLPATAFGTQLNLALLKVYNEGLDVDACLLVRLDPGPPRTFDLRVRDVTFGD